MYYILDENIALRSYWLVPHCFYFRNDTTAKGLKKEEFEFLSKCDSHHDLPEDEMTEQLFKRRFIYMVEKDSADFTDWQKPLVCDNRYVPSMNWMITGKCNYNCVHCFNAADNAPLQSEWTMEEANKLLDEARECGIHGFTLTGGEPMVHKHFMEIVEGIYRRGMMIFELNTNGYYLTQKILDRMKELGCFPKMKISFDGIGYHDWMRGHTGAEEDALRAIKLCVANGFTVMVQMNFNRKNKNSIFSTLELLDEIGVSQTRVIRTSDAPRWEQNVAGHSFSITEYYDESYAVIEKYLEKPRKMHMVFWQLATFDPNTKRYWLRSDACNCDGYRETLPLCRGNRGMIAVAANGDVFPCMQMSGWFEARGENFGNVKETGLAPILRSGKWMDEVTATVGDLLKENDECRACPHLKECRTGCRALAILTGGGLRAPDKTKCAFYQGGYDEKLTELFEGFGYQAI